MAIAYQEAAVHYGRPLEVVTSGLPSSYAATLPIHIPPGLPGPHYMYLRGRVLAGQVGVGILERKRPDPQQPKQLTPSAGMIDLYVPVLFPEDSYALVLSNAAEGGVRSKVLIEDAALLAFSRPLAERRLVRTVDLERVRLADPKASVERSKAGVTVTTRPEQYSYAGRVALGLDAGAGSGVTVHVRARVLEEIGRAHV